MFQIEKQRREVEVVVKRAQRQLDMLKDHVHDVSMMIAKSMTTGGQYREDVVNMLYLKNAEIMASEEFHLPLDRFTQKGIEWMAEGNWIKPSTKTVAAFWFEGTEQLQKKIAEVLPLVDYRIQFVDKGSENAKD